MIALLTLVAVLALGGVVWLVRGFFTPLDATPTPTLTATTASTLPATPIPGLPALRLTRDTDVRGGPGDDYPLVGQMAAGVVVTVVGQDADGAWYNVQLGDGRGWLPRDVGELVEAADETRIPVAGTIPPTATTATVTPTATATATATPTLTATPTATRTPPPLPTATRLPPTATRPPPTSTPVPPTPTPPPPPTNEPEPEPTDPPVIDPTPTPDIPPTADTP